MAASLAVVGFIYGAALAQSGGLTGWTIDKTADSATVAAGQSIGFQIHLHNGSGHPDTMYIQDILPAGTDINWQVASSDPPGACAVSGAPPNQTLGCQALNATDVTVHVTSSTTTRSCGTYQNTALGGPLGPTDVSDNDTTTVAECNTPTPTPSATPTATPTATPNGSATPTPTPKPPTIAGTVKNNGKTIEITYHIGDEASVCDEIDLVQAVRNTTENTGDATKKKVGVKPEDLNVADGATKNGWMTDGGWYVDSTAAENDPYYNGHDADDIGSSGNKQSNGDTKDSDMNDSPTKIPNGGFPAGVDKITYDFVVLIFCSKGTDAGHCFGWYTWQWSQVKGQKPTITPGDSHSGSNADAVAALNKWKDKHPGNNVPAVDCT